MQPTHDVLAASNERWVVLQKFPGGAKEPCLTGTDRFPNMHVPSLTCNATLFVCVDIIPLLFQYIFGAETFNLLSSQDPVPETRPYTKSRGKRQNRASQSLQSQSSAGSAGLHRLVFAGGLCIARARPLSPCVLNAELGSCVITAAALRSANFRHIC